MDGRRRGQGASIFVGTVQATFDAKKGRVAVPAAFRAELAKQGADEIVLRTSSHAACIEVWARPAFDAEVNRRTDEIDPFSAEYDQRVADLVGDALVARPDAEGRIVLPQELAGMAGLDGAIAFAGRSKYFQIWSAARLAAARTERRA